MWPAGDPTYRVHFPRLRSGVAVRAVEQGPPDGPPVLMLPGWGVCAYTFRGNLAGPAAAGYRAIAVDLKGHGRSDKPVGGTEYSLGSLVGHVREIMEALGLERPAVVAQSMAGRIAVELALATPNAVRCLALISPVGLGRVRLIGLGRLSAHRVFDPFARVAERRSLYRIALETAYGKVGTVEPEDVDEYWAQSQFPGFVAAVRSLLGHFDWKHAPGRVAALRVPVTVFRGTRDRIVAADAARLARQSGLVLGKVTDPAATGRSLLVLEGAGHALNEEAPDLLNAALVAAVRGDLPGSR